MPDGQRSRMALPRRITHAGQTPHVEIGGHPPALGNNKVVFENLGLTASLTATPGFDEKIQLEIAVEFNWPVKHADGPTWIGSSLRAIRNVTPGKSTTLELATAEPDKLKYELTLTVARLSARPPL